MKVVVNVKDEHERVLLCVAQDNDNYFVVNNNGYVRQLPKSDAEVVYWI